MLLLLLLFSTAQIHKEKNGLQKFFSLTNRMKCEVLNPHYFSTRSVLVFSLNDTWGLWWILSVSSEEMCSSTKAETRPGWGAVRKPTGCLTSESYQDWEVFKELVLVWSEQFVEWFLYLIITQQSQRSYEDQNLIPTPPPLISREPPQTPLCAVTKATFTLYFSTWVPVVGILRLFLLHSCFPGPVVVFCGNSNRLKENSKLVCCLGKHRQKMRDFWEFSAEMLHLWSPARSHCLKAWRSEEEKHWGFNF